VPGRRGVPERFLTTVVMTDIVGSTEHAAELGDSAWRELLQQHHALIRAALRRHDGREIDTAGDGFFVVFDAPADAVECALEIADEVSRLGIEIRAGIHVGEVQQMARKVTGITVVIASRIMANAGAGEILVSSTVRDLTVGSGLTFDDRGTRSLKGVPGEWNVYAVGREAAETADRGRPAAARDRRAAAVRRAEARPIWQRRPRLAAGFAVAMALIVVAGGLLIARPWQPSALASLAENSIGVIDPDRGEIVGQIQVGAEPGGIAIGEGYAWVTNTSADTVSQIDLTSRSVIKSIEVGRAPTGIIVAAGSVWVTNSGGRTVSRIKAATARVVQTIDVGNGPIAIASAGPSVWVANATDSTVVRLDAQTGKLAIDARTGKLALPIGVATTPDALAADADGLWVASEFVSAISRLNPITGETIDVIPLAGRPSAIALDSDSLWVAAADGTVARIHRDTNGVTATIDVGGQLDSIAITDESVWVGDRSGYVHRLSRTEPFSARSKIATVTSVAALAVVEGNVWAAAQVSLASHRGGTLRILLPGPSRADTDPLGQSGNNVSLLEADGLVGYRRVGGVAGAALLPDLASTIPNPTNGGLIYTFHLRPNMAYSMGEPVRAADFRRAIERSFQIGLGLGVSAQLFFGSIVGTGPCVVEDGPPVDRCDLSKGILTDETTNTVTFNLSKPDPDFLFKLAMPSAYPVPEGVAMHGYIKGVFPGTGPYVVSEVSDTEVRLTRNPRFEVWDAAVRPDGFADEIVFSVVEDAAQRIAMVENEEADYLHRGRALPEPFRASETLYGGQWHVASNTTYAAWMNAAIKPFDNVQVRQAVNLAIDRAHMADVYGGPPVVAITCQVLPPGFPGYRPYCPYTPDPDAGGQWRGADLDTAHRLVEESGTAGMHVVVGPSAAPYSEERDYLGEVLKKLGYDVTVDTETDFDHRAQATNAGIIAIEPVGWGPDYLAPSIFFGLFTCDGSREVGINFCDPEFDLAFKEALNLQATDPAASWKAWADVDRKAVDLALWAPLYNAGGDFVSARVGNYQFSPNGSVLFDQMWVQSGSTGSPSLPRPTVPPPPSTPPNPFRVVRTFPQSVTGVLAPEPGSAPEGIGMAVGPDGLLYVADLDHKVTVIDPSSGAPVRSWGASGTGDGEFGDDLLTIAVASDGLVYVLDRANARIEVFAPDGTYQRQMGGFGEADGQFHEIRFLAVAEDGSVYVPDWDTRTITKFDARGALVWRVGGEDASDPDLQHEVYSLTVMKDGKILATWDEGGTALVLDPSDGSVVGHWPGGELIGDSGEPGVDATGNVYVYQYVPRAIQVFSPEGTLLGGVYFEDAVHEAYELYPVPVFTPDGHAYSFDQTLGLVELQVHLPEVRP
jgi:peptide/nickel transport system substrate-binding protein